MISPLAVLYLLVMLSAAAAYPRPGGPALDKPSSELKAFATPDVAGKTDSNDIVFEGRSVRREDPLANDPAPAAEKANIGVNSVGLPGDVPEEPAVTQSGIESPCSDVIVVFARGTFEPAPIGARVGPPFNASLEVLLASENKTLSFIGVDYPADVVGFLEGGSGEGSRAMAQQLSDAAILCPNASLVSAGYSQGAQLVHNSAKLLSSKVIAHIKVVVTFGDPDNGQSVGGISPSEIDIICHPLDVVCLGELPLDILLILVAEPHLDYDMNVAEAATFVVGNV